MYYRGAAVAIIVYDITRAQTFETLQVLAVVFEVIEGRWLSHTRCDRFAQVWVKELQQYVDNIVIAIVGNKSDLEAQRVRACVPANFPCVGVNALRSSLQEVDAGKAQRYADSIGAIFFETSAKTNSNVFDLFTAISACAAPHFASVCVMMLLALSRVAGHELPEPAEEPEDKGGVDVSTPAKTKPKEGGGCCTIM